MLISHLSRVTDGELKKPLVLSFNIGIGTVKTFVSKLLANVLYTKGENSTFVRRLFRTDMRINAKTIDEKRDIIRNQIRPIIQLCNRILIIFEEIDKMEEGVIDVLFSYFDQYQNDFRDVTFIFSSNDGVHEINHETCTQLNKTEQ